ncbi:MAG: DUF5018 domain-containing protein [Tannerellaceae bacterium]|jgi:hypothetical protein|nr:DUF5018 domain-containing protein [Tannerellaceae bacterium]
MKSQILKFIAIIAVLTTGSFFSSAQNSETALSSVNNFVSSSTAFAIDKNIISFEVANLVDKIIYEHTPYSNYGGIPEAWSPHFWTITLIMAKGTDVTSLTPVITLAPGATITLKHVGVQDFSQQVEYTVICEDGSTVTYLFRAYTQENTRAIGSIIVNKSPIGGGLTSNIGITYYDDRNHFSCNASPNPGYRFERWYVNGSPKGTNVRFSDKIPLINGTGTLTAVFAPIIYYTVSIFSNDTNKGTVFGGGTVVAGGSLHLSATPRSGYAFDG